MSGLPVYEVHAHEKGVGDPHDCGGGVSLLRPAEGDRLLVLHVCAEWDDHERGEHIVKWVAPRLDDAHVVTWGPGGPTIRASILCPACGLHGFVTDGRWTAC